MTLPPPNGTSRTPALPDLLVQSNIQKQTSLWTPLVLYMHHAIASLDPHTFMCDFSFSGSVVDGVIMT